MCGGNDLLLAGVVGPRLSTPLDTVLKDGVATIISGWSPRNLQAGTPSEGIVGVIQCREHHVGRQGRVCHGLGRHWVGVRSVAQGVLGA